MGEATNQTISVLLPESEVAIFCTDIDTLEAAKRTQQDWRFARVKITAQKGGIKEATETFANKKSPDLVIVQEDVIDDALTSKLESLAAHCDESTAAVVVGPINDVYLYRRLVEMGVSDYLVKPVQPDVMADVISKTLVDRLGISDSKLIAVTSAKGGVGVSALSQSLALGLSDILEKKTVLLDLSGGYSTVGVHFGYEPNVSLVEAVKAAQNNDEETLERLLHVASNHLKILACGADKILEDTADAAGLEALLDILMMKYPNMVVDLTHTSPAIAKSVVTRASQVLVLSTPSLASLRLSRGLMKEVQDHRGGEADMIDLVINLQGLDQASEIQVKDIEQAIEKPVAATVSFEKDIFLKAEANGKTIMDDEKGRQLILKTLLPVIQKSITMDLPEKQEEATGFFSSILKKLK